MDLKFTQKSNFLSELKIIQRPLTLHGLYTTILILKAFIGTQCCWSELSNIIGTPFFFFFIGNNWFDVAFICITIEPSDTIDGELLYLLIFLKKSDTNHDTYDC